MTAFESDVAITVVAFNNHELGWSKYLRGSFATEFADLDHAAMARAMGCGGIRMERPDELAAAFAEAFAARTPTVIDVQTSLDTSFSDLVSLLAKGWSCDANAIQPRPRIRFTVVAVGLRL